MAVLIAPTPIQAQSGAFWQTLERAHSSTSTDALPAEDGRLITTLSCVGVDDMCQAVYSFLQFYIIYIMRNAALLFMLALAAYAANRKRGSKHDAWVLE